MSLSDRVRPDCEAAPWVIEEIRKLEADLKKAREEERERDEQRILKLKEKTRADELNIQNITLRYEADGERDRLIDEKIRAYDLEAENARLNKTLDALSAPVWNTIAENARLREAIEDAHGFLSEFEVTSDEDSLGKAYFKAHTSEDWYYILLNKLVSLTPSTPSHNGEIDPTHAHYGSLNEWPS